MDRRGFLACGVRGIGGLVALGAIGCERRADGPHGSRASAPARPAPDAAARIVALSPAVGVTLIDLGLERLVVGRHAWDVALDPSLPACGDVTGMDAETLLSVRPTHLIMEWGQRPLTEPVAGFARRGGWTVVDVSPLLTLAHVEGMTQTVASVVATAIEENDPAGGEALRDRARVMGESMRAAWGDASARNDRLGRAGRVLLLGSTEPPGVLGPGSFHHQLLVSMGGTPALTEGKPWTEADPEDVLALAPDAILILAPRGFDRAHPQAGSSPQPDWDTLRATLGVLGRLRIPAIEHRRVALLDHPLAHTPCARLVEIAREMRGAIGGWSGFASGVIGVPPGAPPDTQHPPASRLGSLLDGE